MKKYFVLILFAFFAKLSISQNNLQDVVYLKNGSIIRGVIIEQIPNKTIKIETIGKSVFVYEMDEIEKITKEAPPQNTNSSKKSGYIGVSFGPSIPVGDFEDEDNGLAKSGFQINILNFGYLFDDNVGISAKLLTGSNDIDIEGGDKWTYTGIMLGPLISIPLSETVEWDIRPMIGYGIANSPEIEFTYYDPFYGSSTMIFDSEEASAVALDIGTSFRFHVSEKASILFSADYFSTNPKFDDLDFKQKIQTVSLGLGVAFRL